MICRPSRWLWGLFPLSLIIALAFYDVRKRVEHDLSERAAAAFREAGFFWTLSSFNGRDAVLEGISFSGKERDAALQIVKEMWGVRTVTDAIKLIASPETYTWLAVKKKERIQIRGYVPTEDDRRAILGFIKAALPDYEVDDKMALAGGSPPRQVWLGAVSYAVVQLAQLRLGNVRLDGTSLTLDGVAGSTEAYRAVKKSLSDQLPSGVELKTVRVLPPVVRPFEWRVKYTGSVIAFSGYVPSDEAHQLILERTRNLFPDVTVEDTMELASGAPESWTWAVAASLTQLYRLKSGRVKLTDMELEFEGVADNEFTAKHVTSSIRNGLPKAYRSNEKITFEGHNETGQTKQN